MISVIDISKTYPNGIKALSNATLEISSGITGLLGPNGSGKTTLMRILTGLLLPTSGTVRILGIDNQDETSRKRLRRHIGYLPQEIGFHDHLSVYQEIDYFALLKGISNNKIRKDAIEQALVQTGLELIQKQAVQTLSGGQRQRLGIAVTLLGDPDIIIVDEPTSGLDPAERVRFRNLLYDLGMKRIVIISTHIVEDISQICEQVAILQNGHVLYSGHIVSLLLQAEERIWLTDNKDIAYQDPDSIISVARGQNGTEYRFISSAMRSDARPVVPTLEDAYLYLIYKARSLSNSTSPKNDSNADVRNPFIS